MVRLLNTLFLTLLSFSTVWAAPYEIIFSEKIGGAENYACVDPIVDAAAQHAGFIYCDQNNNRIIIDDFTRDSLITIDFSRTPAKTVHYYSPKRDTLYVYVLLNRDSETPSIGLVRIFPDGLLVERIPTNCFTAFGQLSAVESQNISLKRSSDGTVQGLWFETALLYDDSSPGMGSSSEIAPTTILYSADLKTEMMRAAVTKIRSGDVTGDITEEFFAFKNYVYSWNFPDAFGNSDIGQIKWTSLSFQDTLAANLGSQQTEQGISYALFTGDFSDLTPKKEIIYQGLSEDLLSMHSRLASHVACYGYDGGILTELWYTEIENARFEHVYADKRLLVGMLRDDHVVFLDYSNGDVVDSTYLGRKLSDVTFFETYSNPSVLNMVGRSGDTVLVYRFDINAPATQATASTSEPVPSSLVLYQNNPNPFNGETRLSFEIKQSQHATLKVYNILGQEVAVLAQGNFAPGTFFAYWDGTDSDGMPQSSGVYFARLQGDSESQIIKLIYVK
ncbi:MAG: T9SS type A sorting domain-containing protein [Candidatus Zixiibacteriota bacterium]